MRREVGKAPAVSKARISAGHLAPEWQYVPVRRLALFIEQSINRGSDWVVFEPNGVPLWSAIRLSAGSFMARLFRRGAMARDAYFVKCDSETTTKVDIDKGTVNFEVGFARLRPDEFVIVSISTRIG